MSRGRIIDVRHWVTGSGNAATTVTRRYRRKLYATTRFHQFNGRRYLPTDLLDQRVETVGQFRSGDSGRADV